MMILTDPNGTHASHCCSEHGCKYGYGDDCPVVAGRVAQEYPCETCEWVEENNREALSRLKTFHLFAGYFYYPRDGLGDYKGSFLTDGEAYERSTNLHPYDWYVIVKTMDDGSLAEVQSWKGNDND